MNLNKLDRELSASTIRHNTSSGTNRTAETINLTSRIDSNHYNLQNLNNSLIDTNYVQSKSNTLNANLKDNHNIIKPSVNSSNQNINPKLTTKEIEDTSTPNKNSSGKKFER